MSFKECGPLAGLVGTCESEWTGLDVAYHDDKGKIAETPFRVKTTFTAFGPVANGDQSPYGLDCRTAASTKGEGHPFHTEVGFRMSDAQRRQVVRCFMMPRASTLVAGGTAEPDAATFELESVLGSNTYGILANKYLDEIVNTTRFDVTITIEGDRCPYDETTVVEQQKYPAIILRTDRNTLTRTSWEAYANV
jgi:hypothetical protein